MKKHWILLMALSFLCSIAACGYPESSASSDLRDSDSDRKGYTFTDDLDREVTVLSTERVAALLGSYADIWYLAGGEVYASADDAWEDFDLPLPSDAVNLGGTKKLNLEKLFSANPDFVIASTNTPQHLEWQSALENAGIPVAYFDVSDFDDYLRLLKVCTDLTGNHDRYQQYGTDIQAQIDTILARHQNEPPQTVLVMRASAASIRAKNSSSTVLGQILKSFGCINIADSDSSLLENLNIESILLQNPERIFMIESGDNLEGIRTNVEQMFRETPLWYELDAVKNGNLYYMDKHLYNLKPNARWAEAYEHVEAILYDK